MPQFTKNLQISPYGVQSPFVMATTKGNDPDEMLEIAEVFTLSKKV